MITLITGVPGSGKSLFLVGRLARFDDWRLANGQPRKVYIDGVPDLKVPHEVIPSWGEFHDGSIGLRTADNWQDWIEPGALLVIDECQRYFRPRASGSKVPPFVAALEVHRSKFAVDIVLVTQRPALIDLNVRGLTGQHFHVREGWFGRYLYEWSECANTESKGDRGNAKRSRYRLNKADFALYTSAPVHNVKSRGKPFVVYLLPLLLTGTVVLAYTAYQSLTSKGKPAPASELVEAATPGATQERTSVVAGTIERKGVTLADYAPAIYGRPETAPLYDEVRKVAVLPVVAACVATASKCLCYSQQGTRLPEINEERCRQILDSGGLFNPYSKG